LTLPTDIVAGLQNFSSRESKAKFVHYDDSVVDFDPLCRFHGLLVVDGIKIDISSKDSKKRKSSVIASSEYACY